MRLPLPEQNMHGARSAARWSGCAKREYRVAFPQPMMRFLSQNGFSTGRAKPLPMNNANTALAVRHPRVEQKCTHLWLGFGAGIAVEVQFVFDRNMSHPKSSENVGLNTVPFETGSVRSEFQILPLMPSPKAGVVLQVLRDFRAYFRKPVFDGPDVLDGFQKQLSFVLFVVPLCHNFLATRTKRLCDIVRPESSPA